MQISSLSDILSDMRGVLMKELSLDDTEVSPLNNSVIPEHAASPPAATDNNSSSKYQQMLAKAQAEKAAKRLAQ